MKLDKPLSLIIGVKDHLEVINLLCSIDENIEVIIVINNSSSQTEKILHKLKFDNFDLKIVKSLTSNLGKVKNIGIENAKNDSVFFLDSDCVLEKETLNKVIKYLDTHEIGKVNIQIKTTGLLSSILAKNRIPNQPNAAYTPGLFFRKTILNKIGGYYYMNDIPWREDFELKQRIKKYGINIHYLEDAIVYHPTYKLIPDLRTAFRCGGGQQVGCSKGYIKPTLKWGGGNNFLMAFIFDIYRIGYLSTYLFYKDCRRLGFVSAVYKMLWKLIFTFGYYSQILFNFLEVQPKIKNVKTNTPC